MENLYNIHHITQLENVFKTIQDELKVISKEREMLSQIHKNQVQALGLFEMDENIKE